MNIEDLKVGMRNVDLKAKIAEMDEPRQVTTRFGTPISLTVATLKDDTGTIKLNLWGDQSEGIEEGKDVEVIGGFVKEFRDELQLSVGRNGSIKMVE